MLLKLNNYRCFDSVEFQLPSTNFILLDNNGSGKTSILSAFYSLHTGQPFPNTKFGNYLKLNCEYFGIGTTDPSWFVNGKISPSGRVTTKYSNPTKLETDQKTILTYQPTDNYWLSQSRGNKLATLDAIISQTSQEYTLLLKELEKLTKSKLEILKKSILNKENDPIMIQYLGQNIHLISLKIWQVRHRFFKHIQNNLSQFSSFISSPANNWEIHWEIVDSKGKKQVIKNLDQDFEQILPILHDIEPDFMSLWQKEVLLEKVLYGANRDDFEIVDKGINKGLNIEQILSRGEMRLFVLWVKKLNTIPKDTIWLLDDVFNELDDDREQILLESIFDKSHQIIATGTRCNLQNLPKFKVQELLTTNKI
jgi:DNA replication and repair protein RecF